MNTLGNVNQAFKIKIIKPLQNSHTYRISIWVEGEKGKQNWLCQSVKQDWQFRNTHYKQVFHMEKQEQKRFIVLEDWVKQRIQICRKLGLLIFMRRTYSVKSSRKLHIVFFVFFESTPRVLNDRVEKCSLWWYQWTFLPAEQAVKQWQIFEPSSFL